MVKLNCVFHNPKLKHDVKETKKQNKKNTKNNLS